MNTKKILGIVAVLALVAVAFVGVGAAVSNPTVYVGNTLQLTATTATEGTVTWTSMDLSLATVGNTGLVTGVAVGTVTIKATDSATTPHVDTFTVDVKNGVAKIGAVHYGTLNDAITAVQTSGSGKLIEMLAAGTIDTSTAAVTLPVDVTIQCYEMTSSTAHTDYTLTISGDNAFTNNGTIRLADSADISGKVVLGANSSIVIDYIESADNIKLDTFNTFVDSAAAGAMLKINPMSSVAGKWWMVTVATTSGTKLYEGVNCTYGVAIATGDSGTTTVVGLEQATEFTYTIPPAVSLNGSSASAYGFGIQMTVPRADTTSRHKVVMKLADSKNFTNNGFYVISNDGTSNARYYLKNSFTTYSGAVTALNSKILELADNSEAVATTTLTFAGDNTNYNTGIKASKAGEYTDLLTFEVDTSVTVGLEGVNATWTQGSTGVTSIDVPVNSVITVTGMNTASATVTINDVAYTVAADTDKVVSSLTLNGSDVTSGSTKVTTTGVLKATATASS